MSITLGGINLVSGVWVDIYQASGIPVGTKIAVQNIGASDVYLSISDSQPAVDSTNWQRIQPNDFPMTNRFGDLGAWAFSPNQGARISVQVLQ